METRRGAEHNSSGWMLLARYPRSARTPVRLSRYLRFLDVNLTSGRRLLLSQPALRCGNKNNSPHAHILCCSWLSLLCTFTNNNRYTRAHCSRCFTSISCLTYIFLRPKIASIPVYMYRARTPDAVFTLSRQGVVSPRVYARVGWLLFRGARPG